MKYHYGTIDTKKTEDYPISEFELSLLGFEGFGYEYWDRPHKMVSDYLIQCVIRKTNRNMTIPARRSNLFNAL